MLNLALGLFVSLRLILKDLYKLLLDFDNKIFGVNEKLFKDKNAARIAESVVNGITGAFHPKSLVNVGKAVKGISNVKLPSKVALKIHFIKPAVPYETIPMHEGWLILFCNLVLMLVLSLVI